MSVLASLQRDGAVDPAPEPLPVVPLFGSPEPVPVVPGPEPVVPEPGPGVLGLIGLPGLDEPGVPVPLPFGDDESLWSVLPW